MKCPIFARRQWSDDQDKKLNIENNEQLKDIIIQDEIKKEDVVFNQDNQKEKQSIKLYLYESFDKNFLPKKPEPIKSWWNEDNKTKNHANLCLPLIMANGLGFDILSPATFEVEWSGDEQEEAKIFSHESKSFESLITNHSACGSFTVQTKFIPKTEKGYFIFMKGIPNERRKFSVMEGLVEAWWSPSTFGLVCLCNCPGKFKIEKGEPIARMVLLNEESLNVNLEISDGKENGIDEIPQSKEFIEKRSKSTHHMLDYFKGLYPNGEPVEYHIKPNLRKEREL